MRPFPWLPTSEERRDIVSGILADVLTAEDIPILLEKLPDAPVAFFSDLLVEVLATVADAEVRRHAQDLAALVRPGSQTREDLVQHTTNNRLSAAAIGDLASQIWADWALATQSHLGS